VAPIGDPVVLPMPTDLDVLVDELYALALERFVPERDLLARQLRADGRREDAARVAALAKPSIVAWAVNQVIRAQPAAAATLWAAGDAVLETQAQVVAGTARGPELRAAIDAERQALAPLVDAARGLMTGSGRFLAEQNIQPVGETLHAAAIDPTARPAVAEGRLTRPLRLTGLEAAIAAPEAAVRRETETAAERERLAARGRGDDEAEGERRRAERERRARRQEAERALVRAERDRDKVRQRIGRAVGERERARDQLEAARRRVEEADAELAAAEERLAAAHDQLEAAEDAVDRARADVEAS
jgi:hypothetical protein